MRVDSFFFDGQSFDILFAALVVAGGTAQRASQARKAHLISLFTSWALQEYKFPT
jgi:hypothetical protein